MGQWTEPSALSSCRGGLLCSDGSSADNQEEGLEGTHSEKEARCWQLDTSNYDETSGIDLSLDVKECGLMLLKAKVGRRGC